MHHSPLYQRNGAILATNKLLLGMNEFNHILQTTICRRWRVLKGREVKCQPHFFLYIY